MSTITDLEDKKTKYQNLKQNLNSILTQLYYAINEGKDLKVNLKNIYSVNESSTPVTRRTSDLVTNMTNTYNYIKNTVIPAIDLKIKDVANDIELENQKDTAA